ncbi:MAG: GGDEF domain-containing protein [Desulfamplus sp.]|nr:GGDEF domain-containing protein [Desulfamplus sp.]
MIKHLFWRPSASNLANRGIWTLTVFILLVIISYLDFLTGYEIELNLLYAIPVLAAAWFTNWRIGLALAFMSPIMLVFVRVSNSYYYSHWAYYILNPLLKFWIFAMLVYWLHTSKKYIVRIKELAHTDGLTGAANRRFFMELMQAEIERSKRYNHPFTIVYFDLDNFKAVNDKFGHSVGDRVLQTTVTYIKNNLRKVDVVARLGGDEFALLLPEIGEEAARIVVSKIQKGLLRAMDKNSWEITFSIGVLTCKNPISTPDEIVKIVDELMYSVKNQGKNAIHYSVIPNQNTL